jgi:hypothetical protein
MEHLPIIQWLTKWHADPFTAPAAKCVDAFDNPLLPRAMTPLVSRPRVAQRGRKRGHFEQHVTLAARALRNMSHRRRRRSGWHVGCNYDKQKRPTADRGKVRRTSRGIRKKESTGLTAIGRDRQRAPGTDKRTRTAPHTSKRPKTPHERGFFLARGTGCIGC